MMEATPAQTCRVEGCTRPPWGERGLGCCEQHERLFDLQAGAEEWELTLSILRPWVEASKHIGVSLLEEVMDDALRRAEKDQSYCRANLERAETEAESL